jgi:arylsulfatase A-like enzyme
MNKYYSLSGLIISLIALVSWKIPLHSQLTNDVLAAKVQKPNIIHIVSDDQGYGDFSWVGNPYLKTPNLDRLKKESVTLERLYTAPLCSPSRASIMTGRHQYRTKVWDTFRGRSDMASSEKTIGEYLQEVGYVTGLFGKWHLGVNYPFRPEEQGFDSTYVQVEAKNDRFHPVFSNNGIVNTSINRFVDDAVADKAIEFISKNSQSPFFASINFFMPHSHFNKQIGEEYIEPFNKFKELNQKQKEVYAMIANLDMNVGRILDAVTKAGLDDNTIIIFHSDNGAEGVRYSTGLKGHKGSVYEGGIRVPCFVKWKGKFEPFSSKTPVAVQDILPTICELTGIKKIDKPFDGISFLPLLKNKKHKLPERFIFQQQQPQQSNKVPQRFVNSCLIGDKYKLVYTNGEDKPELYDIINDKGEQSNLSTKMPDLLEKYKNKYIDMFHELTPIQLFDPSETIVGHPKGGTTMVYFAYIHPDNGFPIYVEKTGKYRIKMTDIQLDLFPNGGFMGLRIGNTIYKMKVEKEKNEGVIEADLAKGSYIIFPYNESMTPKTGIYGGPEFGFRYIIIDPLTQ